ncbi:ABC transporter ATP-binding protein [Microbacterium horticulturae]|uniref:Glutathione import ATP-binding protein GsiA n=1 Tax=Microbacterium horticulturae TaxID=3028316 RepID=A0ABY8C2R4_9MICO|nr:ABC transporter ATP-binding protein [Microbacterium sp. KACC 23027]WEG09346.1 ABC transporter ATP-binding protein [Microbacterium sp. KACC 23027]
MSVPVLELDAVRVDAAVGGEIRTLVHDCTLTVADGEAVGLVGESGSGKTLSTRAVVGLIPDYMEVGGTIRIDGIDVDQMSPRALHDVRARRIGMVFQTPRAHLNRLRTVGDFMTEALVHVAGVKQDAAERRAAELLDEVGITDPYRRLRQHPGDLSGGLLQRVMIAATLAMDPHILLADEITTALDVTTQEEVMAVLADLRRERELAMLFITHDLALAQAVCDRIAVMKDGRTIETHPAATIARDATDEYTRALLSASSGLDALTVVAADAASIPLLQVSDLHKTFQVRGASGVGREAFVAVDGVGFTLDAGGALGIVGESGSGKSTTARIVCGLESADGGSVTVKGESWDAPARGKRERRRRARVVQMVFQDPYQSLDPRQTVRACLAEAVRVHRSRASTADVTARVDELLAAVTLDRSLADARPRALSGGQRQRVAIARALAADPEILVLDEAVSALDVTTQVEILKLLDRIRRETGVALLMISHDLNVVRRLCDHVVVMRSGRIEETGPAAAVLEDPQAQYTRDLLASIPRPGWVPTRRRLGRTKPLAVVTSVTPTVKERR